MATWRTLRCSFCKKTDAEVAKLVAGPGVRICDECVVIASRLMDAPPAQRPEPDHGSLRQRFAGRILRWLGAGDGYHVRSVRTTPAGLS